MRAELDNNLARGLIIGTALRYNASLQVIAADQTLADGMPMALAFDPTNTNRNITLYTPAVANAGIVYHKLFHYGTGTGQLVIKSPAAATIGTMDPGSSADVFYINGAWQVFIDLGAVATQNNASKLVLSEYVNLITLANTNVISVQVPFNFTLTGVSFRVGVPPTTAAKAATLTARVNAVAVTGGVISLTTANSNTTETSVAGTAITAGNTGTAGQYVGVLASAVTAFLEGAGYVEFAVTRSAAP